jgi:hypothetical protein
MRNITGVYLTKVSAAELVLRYDILREIKKLKIYHYFLVIWS